METQTVKMMRATVIKVPDSAPGLLFMNNEQRTFVLPGIWLSPIAPAPNMVVEVRTDTAGHIVQVTPVDQQTLARERLAHLGGRAQEGGRAAAGTLQHGFGTLAWRMGKLVLGAEALLLVAFFFLPTLIVNPSFAAVSLTAWQALDFNVASQTRNGSGILHLLGFIALFAPLAAPFLKRTWAQWLLVAPLVFVVLAFTILWLQMKNAVQTASGGAGAVLGSELGAQMARQIVGQFSLGMGFYLVLLASAVLATRAFRRG